MLIIEKEIFSESLPVDIEGGSIDAAIKAYLNRGGKVTKIVFPNRENDYRLAYKAKKLNSK